MKIRLVGAELLHTDRHGEVFSRFSQNIIFISSDVMVNLCFIKRLTMKTLGTGNNAVAIFRPGNRWAPKFAAKA